MNSIPLQILLADDDIDDCMFFKRALEELPISSQLTIVNEGDQLLKYLEDNIDHPPHVLFLDINMPRKGGQECLSIIKQNEKLNNLAVVMFSTSNSWETIRQLFSCGANVFIHKPSDFAQLKQVIHHALPIAAEQTFSRSAIKYILNA